MTIAIRPQFLAQPSVSPRTTLDYLYQMRATGIITRLTVERTTPKMIHATHVLGTYETEHGQERHTDVYKIPKSVLGICPPPGGDSAFFATEAEAYEAAVPYLEKTVEMGKNAAALLAKIRRQ